MSLCLRGEDSFTAEKNGSETAEKHSEGLQISWRILLSWGLRGEDSITAEKSLSEIAKSKEK